MDWYVPKGTDFRPEYDRDAANQARQSWEGYWSWVKTFYEGSYLPPAAGWTNESKTLLASVQLALTRDELRAILNALGRQISAEWSKDNSVRKINTKDLQTFGTRLQQAKKDDDGSGSTIRAVIGAIQAEVQAKLAK